MSIWCGSLEPHGLQKGKRTSKEIERDNRRLEGARVSVAVPCAFGCRVVVLVLGGGWFQLGAGAAHVGLKGA